MTETILAKIAWILAGVLAYGLLRWGLMHVTHEFRVRAGCEADRWAEDSRLDPKIRKSLAFLADAAYRPATPWIVLICLVAAMLLPLGKSHDVGLPDDVEVAAELVKLKLKLLLALITTSPLASLLASLLAMLVVVAGLLVRSSVNTIKERISEAGDRFFPGRLAGHP